LTKPKADLLQGTLDMLILKALSLGPLHGYGIIQRIRQLSDELLDVEQGSLYPAVYRSTLRWRRKRISSEGCRQTRRELPP
jgi:Transcriptional regulator PadR-like family